MNNLTFPATRVLTCCAFAVLSTCPVLAQIQHSGQPLNWNDDAQVQVNWRTFAPLDLATLEAEDAFSDDERCSVAFGIEHQVDWTMENADVWTEAT